MDMAPDKNQQNHLVKNHHLACLVASACLATSSLADEIHVSYADMPDDVAAYYLDDMKNCGEIQGARNAGGLGEEPDIGIHVGDLGDASIPGRIRKISYSSIFHPLRERKSRTRRCVFSCRKLSMRRKTSLCRQPGFSMRKRGLTRHGSRIQRDMVSKLRIFRTRKFFRKNFPSVARMTGWTSSR